MISELLSTLFATVAQVAFTLTGLFFVAIAGDVDTRRYWFSNRSRRQFLGMSLVFLVIPGFISIFGLLSPPLGVTLPVWPCSAALWGLILIIIPSIILRSKALSDLEEFTRLEKVHVPQRRDLSLLGSFIFAIAIVGFSSWKGGTYGSFGELFIGLALGILIFLGLISIWTLLSHEEIPTASKIIEKPVPPAESKTSISETNKLDVFLFITLAISLFSFVIGFLLSPKSRR